MSIFEIDPDIRKAKTLASDFYTDERYFDISKEKIFERSWQFLGKADEFDCLKPSTILPGFLNEPVLLVKTDESLACLSNVCTHRGKILVEEPCEAKLIRCAYHGRRFSLDGKFLSMPEFEGVEDFPSESDNLRQLAFAARAGFMLRRSIRWIHLRLLLMMLLLGSKILNHKACASRLRKSSRLMLIGRCIAKIISKVFIFLTSIMV